jgi:hypothetical protein
MSRSSSPETRLLRSLVRLHGRDPEGFRATVLPERAVQVMAPCGAAVYPLDGWTSRFVRHLHQGFFDARHPALLPAEHAGSGGGGTG